MATVLLLDAEPERQGALKAALATAGYTAKCVASELEARQALRGERFEMLFICHAPLGDAAAKLAVEAEDRGVRTVVVAADKRSLDALRAKGLICFQAPDALQDLELAMCARL